VNCHPSQSEIHLSGSLTNETIFIHPHDGNNITIFVSTKQRLGQPHTDNFGESLCCGRSHEKFVLK